MTPQLLAERVRNWRHRRRFSVIQAAAVLGMPFRTLNGIEQGRGFRYPTLLLLAIDAMEA